MADDGHGIEAAFERMLEHLWPPARRCREIEDRDRRRECYREAGRRFWEWAILGRLWPDWPIPPRLPPHPVPPWPEPDPWGPWARWRTLQPRRAWEDPDPMPFAREDPDPMPILPEPVAELLFTAVNPKSRLAGFARVSREGGIYLGALQRVEKRLEEALARVRAEIEAAKAARG